MVDSNMKPVLSVPDLHYCGYVRECSSSSDILKAVVEKGLGICSFLLRRVLSVAPTERRKRKEAEQNFNSW